MTVQELFDLSGKVAIVTGGGTNIGKHMAEALCEVGCAVAICSRRGELCEQVAAELSQIGPPTLGLRCDVTQEGEVNAMVAEVAGKLGPPDIVVNDAGGAVVNSWFPEADLDEFRQSFEINACGSLLVSQAAAKHMIPRGWGKIILVSSIYGVVGGVKWIYEASPGFKRASINYAAAKGALVQMTRHLATTLGEHNIGVNCISPGGIFREQDPNFVERYVHRTPLGRMGTETDLKGVTVLLASRASDWITGQNILVDGGWTAW
jgi:NAD(P)-dependent dehydrogenase (short-subunit alcohol dehydrogenase family)